MTASFHDETSLVQQAVGGDADAFGDLYLKHMDAIYRYVLYRVGNAHDVEDLTEQVFLKAWEALPSYEYRGHPFSSWLYRIAHNVVVDHHRRRRPALAVPLAGQTDLASDEESALERIIRAGEISELASAISQLNDDQQQVIVLRFVEGLSHDQVAQILDRSPGACRVLQHRALAALNRLLTERRHA